MKGTQSQTEQILEELRINGFVSNFWAIENRILRLSPLIHLKRCNGYHFRTEYGDDLGLGGKNYYYYLEK